MSGTSVMGDRKPCGERFKDWCNLRLELFGIKRLLDNSETCWGFYVIIISLFFLLFSPCILNFISVVSGKSAEPRQLEYILVFCGSLTNITAILGIAGVKSYFQNPKVRHCLTVEMAFLAVALGWASYLLSFSLFGDNAPMVVGAVAAAVVILVFWFLNKRNATLLETYTALVTLVFFCLALLLTPLFGVFRNVIGHFIEPRISPYIHLVAIPVLFTVVDFILRDALPKAKDSLPLDFALVLTGIACVSSGYAVSGLEKGLDSALFESGSAAVVLVFGNWIWLLMTNPPGSKPAEPVEWPNEIYTNT